MGYPIHRSEEFGTMSASELEALAAVGDPPQSHKRHEVIRREDEKPMGFFLLVDGWVAASHILRDGQRQILKVHLPGDALGTPSMCVTRTVEELRAITDAATIHVPFDRFWRLFEEHPRLAARFMLSVQLERVALMDRIVSIGRTSAQARVAALLLDLIDRLEPLGLIQNDSFFMVLTQVQIADVLGLTDVHTNRTLRTLENKGLLSRFGQQYRIVDRAALEELASQPARERRSAQAWLPAPR